jgi:hypothetical protein
MTRSDAVYVRASTSPQEEQSQIDAIQDYLLWTTHVLTASEEKGGTKYLIIMPDGNRYERTVPPRKSKTDRIIYVPTQEAPEPPWSA